MDRLEPVELPVGADLDGDGPADGLGRPGVTEPLAAPSSPTARVFATADLEVLLLLV